MILGSPGWAILLRTPAQPIDPAEIVAADQQLIDDMFETMHGSTAWTRGAADTRGARLVRRPGFRPEPGSRRRRVARAQMALITRKSLVGDEVAEEWEGCLSI
jgi:peptide deformylase